MMTTANGPHVNREHVQNHKGGIPNVETHRKSSTGCLCACVLVCAPIGFPIDKLFEAALPDR